MKEPWTGDLVGRMHNAEVTYQELADEAGIVKAYVSQILNGARTPKNGRERLENAFDAIIQRRQTEEEIHDESEIQSAVVSRTAES